MISVLKIPFDACIVEKERRGAAKGPDAVISELKLPEAAKILEVKEQNDFEKLSKDIEKVATEEHKKKNFVIGLGGDHSVSYGLMKAFAKTHKNAGLIYFDAHLDCDPDFLPPTHEGILRAVSKENLFKQIMVIGARNYTQEEAKFSKDEHIFDFIGIYDKPTSQCIMSYIPDIFGSADDAGDKITDELYLSIDIDVFDPEFAPGTGYPEKNGYKPDEILYVIKELIKTGKVKGADIVEVSPPKDVNNMTSKLAARLLLEFLNINA